MIQKAFPSYLHKDAAKIADFLQQNDPKSFKTIGTEVVCLNGEVLELKFAIINRVTMRE